ncbi:MAG TPA: GNAT family N-acetyltransferase [Solirubrobacteraceae bacterium]|jgi:hypothetical protein
MANATSISIRPFADRDEAAVLELLRASFEEWPREVKAAPQEFFRWKHLQCPFGPSIKVVAEAEGAVVGFEGHLPWKLKVGRQTLQSSRGTDLCVHSSYRRRGVSIAIRGAIELSPDVALTWSNPSPQSRPGSLRFGRSDVGLVPPYVRPTASLPKRLRSVIANKPTEGTVQADAESAGEALRHRPQISRLLTQVASPPARLTTDRTLDYLQWRYGQFDEYRAICSEPHNGPAGIVIFRVHRRGAIWISDVCEVLVERNDLGATRALLRRVRAAASSDVIVCNFQSHREAASFGFVQHLHGPQLVTLPRRNDLVPDPTRIDSWALSRGDLELL